MDYPRDYTLRSFNINYGKAFVIMPFGEISNSQFDQTRTLGLIKAVCMGLKIEAIRCDAIPKQNYVISNILEQIVKSEIIIADITGSNANVFYELGIAHSLRPRHSVILITNDKDIPQDSPFDIRHWFILQYDYSNEELFKSELDKRIRISLETIDNKEFLTQLLGGHSFDSSRIQKFISDAKDVNSEKFEVLCNILNQSKLVNSYKRKQILDIYQYLTTLGDIENQIYSKIMWLLKRLIYTSDYMLSERPDIVKELFLVNWNRSGIDMADIDYWELISNICFEIIDKDRENKADAITWLTNYLENARMGRIDKVRGNIEAFMLVNKNEDLDKAILAMLRGKARSAKESAIDICGQKPICASIDSLLSILKENESDPHLIRSSINALARMEVHVAADLIFDWMENNQDKWGAQAVSSSLFQVAQVALKRLDTNAYNRLIKLGEVK